MIVIIIWLLLSIPILYLVGCVLAGILIFILNVCNPHKLLPIRKLLGFFGYSTFNFYVLCITLSWCGIYIIAQEFFKKDV